MKSKQLLSVLTLSEFRKSPISQRQPEVIRCAPPIVSVFAIETDGISYIYTIYSVGLCVLLSCRVWGYF